MKNILRLCAMAALGTCGLPCIATATPKCSIHPPSGATDTELHKLAQVSQAQAERSARARLGGRGKITISSAELEAEGGCLIWSFDLSLAGQPGVEEVIVDAGNGRVLGVHHEGAAAEAAEAASESHSKNPARNQQSQGK